MLAVSVWHWLGHKRRTMGSRTHGRAGAIALAVTGCAALHHLYPNSPARYSPRPSGQTFHCSTAGGQLHRNSCRRRLGSFMAAPAARSIGWRTASAVGALHRLVHHLYSSGQRRYGPRHCRHAATAPDTNDRPPRLFMVAIGHRVAEHRSIHSTDQRLCGADRHPSVACLADGASGRALGKGSTHHASHGILPSTTAGGRRVHHRGVASGQRGGAGPLVAAIRASV